MKASNNYLALRNSTGHYYLNGNWRIDYPQKMDICGTTFHYERKYKNSKAKGPLTLFAPESVRALGPTTCSLFIVVCLDFVIKNEISKDLLLVIVSRRKSRNRI